VSKFPVPLADLKPLIDTQAERDILTYEAPQKNGYACPRCNVELYDHLPYTIVLSKPKPKIVVTCACGFQGSRSV